MRFVRERERCSVRCSVCVCRVGTLYVCMCVYVYMCVYICVYV